MFWSHSPRCAGTYDTGGGSVGTQGGSWRVKTTRVQLFTFETVLTKYVSHGPAHYAIAHNHTTHTQNTHPKPRFSSPKTGVLAARVSVAIRLGLGLRARPTAVVTADKVFVDFRPRRVRGREEGL